MNTFRPVRIRSQRKSAAPSNASVAQRELHAPRGQIIQRDANAGWWLTRMMLQSRELDGLLSELRHQRRVLPADGPRRQWRPPPWLDASLSLSLVRDEYDALIMTLSARHADLARTYPPLMAALQTGAPVPAAVVSIIVA